MQNLRQGQFQKSVRFTFYRDVFMFRPRILYLAGMVVLWAACVNISAVQAEGRMYEHDPEGTHCTLWDNLRLVWPQTILGREPAKCRRKAVQPTRIAVICRLQSQYIDKDTGSRMCVYRKQGRGTETEVVSLSPQLSCQRTYHCRFDD